MSQPKPARLVEGIDYYMDSGKFVFMAAYHLRRGYCCNSKCRHCPYGRDGRRSQTLELVGMPLKRPARGG
jgi:hypothetical protein